MRNSENAVNSPMKLESIGIWELVGQFNDDGSFEFVGYDEPFVSLFWVEEAHRPHQQLEQIESEFD